MISKNKYFLGGIFLGIGVLMASAVLACSSCGCPLTSDWESQGLTATPGLSFDLRYDYLNQTDLRSGGHGIDRASISLPPDSEVEGKTRNHYATLMADYSPNQAWGFSVHLPYIDRYHETFAPGDDVISTSKSRDVGDMRVVVRYQGFPLRQIVGVQFGLKLPTGRFHDSFRGGPQAGAPLDRGLEPGTGTTDALIGLYHFGSLSQNWDYFIQGMGQIPLRGRDNYKPGASFSFNTGVHYLGFERVTPQLQVNVKTGSRDTGDQADGDNSGGTLVYFSPGATISLTSKLKIYGFIQLPVYQYVNGSQLTPKWIFSTGIHYAL
jgi:hypothetical protein